MTSSIPELNYLVRGAGPGVALAHGGTGSVADNFGPLIDPLAQRYTVVGADYPGSGATPRATTPLTLDALADEVVHTAVRADVPSFAMVGYSMGCAVAVRAATRHPDRVSALVLTAGFTHPNPRLRLAVDLWRALISSGDRAMFAQYMTLIGAGARWLHERTAAELRAQVDSTVPGAGDLDQLALIDSIDIRQDLPAITVPTLVIATTADHLTPESHSRELAEGIPGALLDRLDSGHLVWAERGTEWLGMITEFLSTVDVQ